MTEIELLKEWISANPLAMSVIKFVIVLLVVLFAIQFIRRYIKHLLNDKIRVEIEKTKGKIILASATVELIRIPDINVNLDSNSKV